MRGSEKMKKNSDLRLQHQKGEMNRVLFEQRIICGMTQKEVAEKAGIPISSYQKFESGERNIMTASFRIAGKVIEALEMDITRFYHDEYIIEGEIYIVGKRLLLRRKMYSNE